MPNLPGQKTGKARNYFREMGIFKFTTDLGGQAIRKTKLTQQALKFQDLLFNPIIKDKAGEISHPHVPHGQPCGIPPYNLRISFFAP
jgi:hypothetical protein